MNYRPDIKNLFLWDTWMYPDPDGVRMHLFFLANRPEKPWQWVGHAVSEDLVHWRNLPEIPLRRQDDTCDVGESQGTGMVFASPRGGGIMSYTANLSGPQQQIAFLHSDDLIRWEKRREEPCILPQAPYYETDGTKCVCSIPAFRDAFVHRVGDHYEALIGAHAAYGQPLHRGCIARYKSTDPELHTWEPLPPIIGPDVTMLMEVPEYFQIGSKHYLLWSTGFWFGRCDTRSRRECFGTFYAMSDSYEGPYSIPEDNLLIGCSRAAVSYVGRTILWHGQRLLYHHLWAPCPSLAFPKRILQQQDGRLTIAFWPGIDQVHAEEVRLPLDRITNQNENLPVGQWEMSGDRGLIGSMDRGGILGLLPIDLADVHLQCHVTVEAANRFGITLRDPGHAQNRPEGISKKIQGVALQGDLQYGEWQFGTPEHFHVSRIDPDETIFEAPVPGRTYRIDLVVRDIYFEAYIDGVWKFTRIIKERARRGGIGFFVEDGTVRFGEIRAWTLEPMSHPFPDS